MREIKFRAWDSSKKIMHFGREFSIALNGDIRFLDVSPCDYALRDQEIMQFTGLLDKNGKEIYEGDIVKYDDSSFGIPNAGYRKCVVAYIAPEFAPYALSNVSGRDVEIIGNIHENPELVP